jgi:FKBP-type peptidyl-prolyl cis-trans isomerase/outer membrane lipoprotein-sorting protein
MKTFLTTTFLFLLIFSSFTQQISVKSFRILESDQEARIISIKKDQNGKKAAIIKVVTSQTGFVFDFGMIGNALATEQKTGEIWVWVPAGARKVTINHQQLGVLRNYEFEIDIQEATVYEMILVTGKVITTVEETIASQWLLIRPTPASALVYIDNQFVSTGEYQAKLKAGSYNYRVEAPLYHSDAGKFEITNTKKELLVNLLPAFGYVQVNTSPEQGAKIIIDDKELSATTPAKSEALASGEHTVRVIKEMYQPTKQKVTVTDGQTTPVNFTLQPNFAQVSISSVAGANIFINGDQKGTGTWNGRLNAGVYSLEARLDNYRPAKQDIELMAGDNKKLDLQPTPIYGSVDIITKPSGATITINDKKYGTTPFTITDLLIGDYNIQLDNVGFESVNKKVTVNDGKNTEIFEIMSKLEIVRNLYNKNSNTILRNEVDSMSYCLGINVGTDFAKNLKGIPGGISNKDKLILGFSTAMKEEKGLINNEKSQEYFKKYIEKSKTENKTAIKNTKKYSKSVLVNDVDSMSYCLGINVGTDFAKNIKGIPGGKSNKDLLINGFATALNEEKGLIDTLNATVYFKKYIEKAQLKENAIKIEDEEKFLTENKTKIGVITTVSGLQYIVLVPKNGIKPNATDSVKVHYVGTLVDGTKFDSSIDRGEPITFPLNQVIPGWTEGVQLMSVGSKYKFFVPYKLGYGEKGAGNGAIPGFSTLIFEVELLDIKHKKN